MILFFKNKAGLIYLILFLFSVSPFVLRLFEKKESQKPGNELFRHGLIQLDNLEKMSSFIDGTYGKIKNTPLVTDTALYVKITSRVVKERFYHGLLDYKFSENWPAYMAGKTTWKHFASIVEPNDILKHTYGLCSQQTIIFMELLKKRGIDVRSVGLGYKEGPGHFLSEVNYGGDWHLYDVSVEPEWLKLDADHMGMDYYMNRKDSLYKAYATRLPKDIFYKLMDRYVYGTPNEFPAKKMRIFHQATFVIMYLMPFIFGLLFLRSRRKKQTVRQIEVKSDAVVETDSKAVMPDMA